MAWDGYFAALSADTEGVNAVLEAGRTVGADPRDLAWAIEVESGWNPEAQNPSTKASGLLQWMPSTLKAIDAPLPEDVIQSTRTEQAKWVAPYFKHVGAAFRMTKPGDTLLAIFMPSALGKKDSAVIGPVQGLVWKRNPGYRSAGDGPITAGSVRAIGTPPASGGPEPGAVVPEREKPRKPAPGTGKGSEPPWFWVLLILAMSRKGRGSGLGF